MTAPIPPNTIGSNSLVGSGSDVLGKEDFLELLVTQLRHQDPLNPMDGTQFASQLAEFSGLEQLIAVNDGIESISGNNALAQVTMNTSLSASLIGKEILGFGDQIELTGASQHTIVADIGANGSARIELFDASGNPIGTRELGGVAAGPRQELTFDTSTLGSGRFHYRLTVTGSDGTPVPVEQYVRGTVNGVFFGADGVVLRVGNDLRVALDNLAEIEPA